MVSYILYFSTQQKPKKKESKNVTSPRKKKVEEEAEVWKWYVKKIRAWKHWSN